MLTLRTALLAMTLLGCGSRSGLAGIPLGDDAAIGYRWEAGVGGGRVRALRACVEDWHILYESEALLAPPLAMAAGELIFGTTSERGASEIRALDVTSPSRSVRVVRRGPSHDLWIEGDELLVWTREQIVSVPLQGGGEEVLFDARSAEASGQVDGVLVQSDVIYWARADDDSTRLELWQEPRGGEPPRLVGSVDRGATGSHVLAASPDAVIVTGGRSAVAFSLLGEEPRLLADVPDGQLAGVDGLGGYYVRAANRTRRGGRAIEFEILRAPVDGSASTRFWRGSAGQHLTRLWPAESGWIAIGDYYMFDGTPHAVIAHLDASGDEVLIACDRADNQLLSRPVFWQHSFYAITGARNLWRIVEIRLPE